MFSDKELSNDYDGVSLPIIEDILRYQIDILENKIKQIINKV